jgi:uncharacterized protein YkwD
MHEPMSDYIAHPPVRRMPMARIVLILLLVPLLCLDVGCHRKRATTTTADAPAFSISQADVTKDNITSDPTHAAPSGPSSPPAGPVSDFITLFSNARVASPAGPIPWDPVLAGAAQAHLDALVNAGVFDLNYPTGVSLALRAVSSGASYDTMTYGVAKRYATAQELFTALSGDFLFMNAVRNYTAVSPTGIGVAYSSSRGGLWAFIIIN